MIVSKYLNNLAASQSQRGRCRCKFGENKQYKTASASPSWHHGGRFGAKNHLIWCWMTKKTRIWRQKVEIITGCRRDPGVSRLRHFISFWASLLCFQSLSELLPSQNFIWSEQRLTLTHGTWIRLEETEQWRFHWPWLPHWSIITIARQRSSDSQVTAKCTYASIVRNPCAEVWFVSSQPDPAKPAYWRRERDTII